MMQGGFQICRRALLSQTVTSLAQELLKGRVTPLGSCSAQNLQMFAEWTDLISPLVRLQVAVNCRASALLKHPFLLIVGLCAICSASLYTLSELRCSVASRLTVLG